MGLRFLWWRVCKWRGGPALYLYPGDIRFANRATLHLPSRFRRNTQHTCLHLHLQQHPLATTLSTLACVFCATQWPLGHPDRAGVPRVPPALGAGTTVPFGATAAEGPHV